MTDYKRVEYDNKPVLVARADTQATSTQAQQATKLANARSIKTDLGSASQASFDGSADVTPGVSGVLPIQNGGTGSNVQNFVDLNTNQLIIGQKSFDIQINITRTVYAALFNGKRTDVNVATPSMQDIASLNATDNNDITIGSVFIRLEQTGIGRIIAQTRNQDGTYTFIALAGGS